jgi:hypothetical protein
MTKNAENQRKFKERLYARGYRQTIVWVKRDEERDKRRRIDRLDFILQMDEIARKVPPGKVSGLYKKTLRFVEESFVTPPNKK